MMDLCNNSEALVETGWCKRAAILLHVYQNSILHMTLSLLQRPLPRLYGAVAQIATQ